MRGLKCELARIITEDNLELHGLLFEPNKKDSYAVIHVHGWIGNFYENELIEYIAKEAVSKGFAFLTFNNRGTGIISDISKKGNPESKYARIGGSLENFEECIFDIGAAINFLKKRGYTNIILEGHSLGCQKVAFYKYKTNDECVKGLVLIAPVDDVGYTKRFFGNKKYEESLVIAREMVKNGTGSEVVPKWMEFYPLLNANRYLDIADAKTTGGKLFDYSGELKKIKKVDCSILAIFGSKDDYESEPDKKLDILKSSVKNCDTKLFQNANHWLNGYENELGTLIVDWVKSHNE